MINVEEVSARRHRRAVSPGESCSAALLGWRQLGIRPLPVQHFAAP